MSSHKDIMESGGFTIFKGNGKAKSKGRSIDELRRRQYLGQSNNEYNENKFCVKIEDYTSTVQSSAFFNKLLELLKDMTKSDEKIDIVCYGIGDLLDSQLAQTQFACLSLIVQTFDIRNPVKLYDPVMVVNHTPNVLEQFNKTLQDKFDSKFTWFDQNDECRHIATSKTVFFMPHCSLQMYLNVLRTNIHDLSKVIIIGNSFNSYTIRSNHKAINALIPHMTEYNFDKDLRNGKTKNNPLYESFNDTSIHCFTIPQQDTWNKVVETVLNSGNDTQFTSELITNEFLTQVLRDKLS